MNPKLCPLYFPPLVSLFPAAFVSRVNSNISAIISKDTQQTNSIKENITRYLEVLSNNYYLSSPIANVLKDKSLSTFFFFFVSIESRNNFPTIPFLSKMFDRANRESVAPFHLHRLHIDRQPGIC